jgi:hypothetical protein
MKACHEYRCCSWDAAVCCWPPCISPNVCRQWLALFNLCPGRLCSRESTLLKQCGLTLFVTRALLDPKLGGCMMQCTNESSSYIVAFGGSLRGVQVRNETPRCEKGVMMRVMLFFRSRVPVCHSFDVLRCLCRAMWMLRSMRSGRA